MTIDGKYRMAQTLTRVLQIASAASPVGSFAYSEGLETCVATGNLRDRRSAQQYLEGLLTHSLGGLDLPLLTKMYQAWEAERPDSAVKLDTWLLASRETAELRASDRHQGRALMRIAAALGIADHQPFSATEGPSYACAFAFVSAKLGVSMEDAAVAFAYAWLENLVLALVKLVPLGQSDGQRIIFELAGLIPTICHAAASIDLDDVAAGAPGQALASALHESLTTRLYRS
ncbi:MAG: urease accessory protein UreF [Chromatiales bacterium]|jgi:urease accessory protein|nr:urease accessory protein UreF [Chromatiales bacterium]